MTKKLTKRTTAMRKVDAYKQLQSAKAAAHSTLAALES
jgi:hypothetical protein